MPSDCLLLNDGTGMFTDVTSTRLPPTGPASTYVLPLDKDRDGDIDLIWGSYQSDSMVMENDGSGTFHVSQVLPFGHVRQIVAGDVDGDGHADLFFACEGRTSLLLSDRFGGYVDGNGMLPDRERTEGAALVDLDGDGRLDLVLAGRMHATGAKGARILRNTGQGFRDVTTTTILAGNETFAEHVDVVDADADGDFDIASIVAQPAFSIVVLTGLRRHLHVPHAIRHGTTLPLTLHARAGHVLLPVLGPRIPQVPIAGIGSWWLHPLASVPLPPVGFPDASPRVLQLPVPNDPTLAGLELGVQALDAGALELRTTNWLPFRIF